MGTKVIPVYNLQQAGTEFSSRERLSLHGVCVWQQNQYSDHQEKTEWCVFVYGEEGWSEQNDSRVSVTGVVASRSEKDIIFSVHTELMLLTVACTHQSHLTDFSFFLLFTCNRHYFSLAAFWKDLLTTYSVSTIFPEKLPMQGTWSTDTLGQWCQKCQIRWSTETSDAVLVHLTRRVKEYLPFCYIIFRFKQFCEVWRTFQQTLT